jgi:outer membrane cobalamin receptor
LPQSAFGQEGKKTERASVNEKNPKKNKERSAARQDSTSTPSSSSSTTARRAAYKFDEVRVGGDRIQSPVARIAAPSSQIRSEEIQALGARQTADVLQLAPGAFVRNYGGMGGVKTLSLRGAGGAQTAALLEGVRVQSTQSGQFDFSALPAAFVEEIEIARGGAGALVGANALAGAVNIRLRGEIKRAELALEAENGSFEETRLALGGAFPLGVLGASKGGVLARVEYQSARGNYPFTFNAFGQNLELERNNADFRNIAALAAASAQTDDGRWTIQARAVGRISERGAPGAVVQGNIEMERARLDESDALTLVRISYIPAAQALFSFAVSGKFNVLAYRDPDARQFGANGLNERFLAEDFSASARFFFEESTPTTALEVRHEWTLEHIASYLRGNMFQPGVGNAVERLNTAIAARAELVRRFNGEAKNGANAGTSGALHASAALRADYFSDVGLALSPLVGAAWKADSLWTLRAEWSYNFRPPAFNELYYLNFGNVALKPERALCWNVGVSLAGEGGAPDKGFGAALLEWTADAYWHVMENQILAVQQTPFTISAQNIASSEALGVETSLAAVWQSGLMFRAQYGFQRAVNLTKGDFSFGKQLVYTPSHLASAAALWKWEDFLGQAMSLRAGAQANYVGARYFLPDNSPEARLAPFATVGVSVEAEYRLPFANVSARLLLDNLFDARYAVIRNFPMPGRAARFFVSLVLF